MGICQSSCPKDFECKNGETKYCGDNIGICISNLSAELIGGIQKGKITEENLKKAIEMNRKSSECIDNDQAYVIGMRAGELSSSCLDYDMFVSREHRESVEKLRERVERAKWFDANCTDRYYVDKSFGACFPYVSDGTNNVQINLENMKIYPTSQNQNTEGYQFRGSNGTQSKPRNQWMLFVVLVVLVIILMRRRKFKFF